MSNIEDRDMDNVIWGASVPNMAINYTPSPDTKLYASAEGESGRQCLTTSAGHDAYGRFQAGKS
jgi:hypothetical protein